MNFVGCVPRFIKAHGGWILTALGVAGFGATVILTANAAPKVKCAIEEEVDERIDELRDEYPPEDGVFTDEWFEEHSDEMKLTFWEKAEMAIPYYAPAILLGTATVGCMIGAQIFNMKQQAMLVGMYATLATQFDKYREAVKAQHGEEADRIAFDFSKREIEDLKAEIARLKEENGPYLYGIATLPGVIFEAKPVDVQEAIMHFNRNLILGGENNFTELYEFLGLPDSCYNHKISDVYGYNQYMNEVDFGYSYADFDICGVFSKSGRMVNIITPVLVPYRIDNWDDQDPNSYDLPEELPNYNFDRAKHLAESYLDKSQLTKAIHQEIYAPGLFAQNGVSQQKHLF